MRTAFLLALVACSTSSTRIDLSVSGNADWDMDHYEIEVANHWVVTEALPQLTLQVPDEIAGASVMVDVWGLTAGQQIAHGTTTISLPLHRNADAQVTLISLGNCGTFCSEGQVECLGDGLSTCTRQQDGCLTWLPPAPCPIDTPFCSNGSCSTQCSDECVPGQTTCDSDAAMRTCGQNDGDPCLDWSAPMACANTQTCADGACSAPMTCAQDGSTCDDGDACTINDRCAGNTCSGMPKCTGAPTNADPTCSSGTCGFACHSGYVKSGSGCVPQVKHVFVSSATYTGNLGGIAGADAECQSLAMTAGLGAGVFKAWLADSTGTAPITRMTHSMLPYRLVDDTTVALDWTHLISGMLAHALNVDELGHTITTDRYVWTTVLATGQGDPTTDPFSYCNDWKGSDGIADVGSFDKTTAEWTHAGVFYGCDGQARLYCVEQ